MPRQDTNADTAARRDNLSSSCVTWSLIILPTRSRGVNSKLGALRDTSEGNELSPVTCAGRTGCLAVREADVWEKSGEIQLLGKREHLEKPTSHYNAHHVPHVWGIFPGCRGSWDSTMKLNDSWRHHCITTLHGLNQSQLRKVVVSFGLTVVYMLMARRRELSECERGMVVGARRMGHAEEKLKSLIILMFSLGMSAFRDRVSTFSRSAQDCSVVSLYCLRPMGDTLQHRSAVRPVRGFQMGRRLSQAIAVALVEGSEEIWAALTIEVLRANNGEVR
ncbi:hypothetical protein PR048_014919 [Dryococelus australis]|uniref:Uncharacterized protein n=1 Tax=Dryococelus australis TaxID=614101 RepID=A0ABQ9HFG9_9NEOP|nr:hypothetical protein PR048_014919 [Dryococelus australis]